MDGNATGVLQEKGITRWVVEAGRKGTRIGKSTQAQRRESTSSQEMSEVIVDQQIQSAVYEVRRVFVFSISEGNHHSFRSHRCHRLFSACRRKVRYHNRSHERDTMRLF